MAKVVPIQPTLFDLAVEQAEPRSASESSTPDAPLDNAARLQALDVDRSFIVEAPAGSGKTGLLIQRFLKLLADPSVTEPEQVLAITFTIKATTEMRARVLDQLEAARSNSAVSSDFDRQTRAVALAVLERDRQHEWDLLHQPQRLNIRTIDSVCAEIARTLPVLSGSGGRLKPTNDARPLYREAARQTLLLLGTPQSDPIFDAAVNDLLLHRDGNLADCEELLADMLSLRDQWGTLIPLAAAHLDDEYLDTQVLPRLEQALEQAICSGLTQLARVFPPGILAELADIAGHLGHAAPHKSLEPSPIAACAGVRTPPGMGAADLEQWSALIYLLMTKGGELRKERGLTAKNLRFEYDRKGHHHTRLSTVLDALRDRDDLLPVLERVNALPPARYPANQWAVAKSLFRILSRALVQLQLVFATRGQCDFTELTLLARTALQAESGPEDLASALGARLQHLLVDEMQDTSASQYELLHQLTASWDGHSQTVFLVGDPRQSIYLFRQARVESFLQTMQTGRLGELPLTPLRLTANFRSQQTLVTHFNRDFDLVFADESEANGLPHSPAESILPPSSYAGGLTWHGNPVEIRPALPLPSEDLRTPAQLRQRQARRNAIQMRRVVERWFRKELPSHRQAASDREVKPWRIAVLARNRNHLAEILAEFDSEKRGPRIPYRAVEIAALSDRQEILDLTALTRTLLHPADRVAGLAVLRAPWCGLSLADLHTLTGADDPNLRKLSIRRLMTERGDLLPPESIERIQRVWTILERAADQLSRLSTARLVERVWRSLGGDAWLTESELGNARRFFRLLDEMETEAGPGAGPIDPSRLVTHLQRLYAEPGIPRDAPFPYVELLTIHSAKGLEWDVVLVPALERSPGANRPRLLTWAELGTADPSNPTGAASILLAPIAAKGEEVDALTSWLKDIYKKREAAERKRLFYVASTRAREELHLFAAPDLTTRGDLNPRWDSLLKSAWAAAEPQFADFWQARMTAALRPQEPVAASHEAAPPSEDVRIESDVLDIAASAPAQVLRPSLKRLPADFDPAATFAAARAHKLPDGEPDSTPTPATLFDRPEGSFAARSFGNAVHDSLEMLARRIAAGHSPAQLLTELPTWTPRIAALLRADGLPRTTVDRLAREARTALENALRALDGRWLLEPHPGAASEFSLTSWTGQNSAPPASVRTDRIFHAGSEPRTPGDDFLWIIDFKTSTHSGSGLEEFLAKQREAYAPQLEAYARILAPARSMSLDNVRLALYFPTLPRLLWWKFAQP